ncbi:MAG: VRR-NUC domain-containing protein [Peptococcales bacterium]|jgi:hypothetical protein
MDEKYIEKRLVMEVKKLGGLALKLSPIGFDGMPDRLILLPNSRIAFIEVKAEGENPRPLQLKRHRTLRKLGFKVYVLDNKDQIGGILSEIQTT